jgi:hypothetical protein
VISTKESIAVAIAMGKLNLLAAQHGGGAVGVERAFRELSKVLHPDAPGGDADAFRILVAARRHLHMQQTAIEYVAKVLPGPDGPPKKETNH